MQGLVSPVHTHMPGAYILVDVIPTQPEPFVFHKLRDAGTCSTKYKSNPLASLIGQ